MKPKAKRQRSAFRKRMEKSQTLAWIIGSIAGVYLSLCKHTIRWQVEGLEELQDTLKSGPVLYVMWHGRCLMAGDHWPASHGQLSTLHNSSPVGRLAGALHWRLGLKPMEMSRKRSNQIASRQILKRMKEGASIGLTADGPLGPIRQLQDAPLEWARVSGLPVYGYAFSVQKGKRLATWDRMMVPRPFSPGAIVFARFDQALPRRASQSEIEAVRVDMAAFLDRVTARADALAQTPVDPLDVASKS